MEQKIERVPANLCGTPFEKAIDEKIAEMNYEFKKLEDDELLSHYRYYRMQLEKEIKFHSGIITTRIYYGKERLSKYREEINKRGLSGKIDL